MASRDYRTSRQTTTVPIPGLYLTVSARDAAWAVATCFFWSAVLSLTFPSLLADAGPVGAFGFYVRPPPLRAL